MTRRAIVTSFLGLFFYCLVPFPSASADLPPRVIVERWQESLIQIMKGASSLGVKGRYERLMPDIERTFHLPTMVRIAASSHWADINSSQRDQLVAAFMRMSVSILATLLDSYDGETFRFKGEKPGPKGTMIVDTELVRTSKSTISFTYILRNYEGRWLVLDVVIDNGISEISVRRSEYKRILETEGVDGLIAALNGKADQLIASVDVKGAAPKN